jgi:hypothetical protein
MDIYRSSGRDGELLAIDLTPLPQFEVGLDNGSPRCRPNGPLAFLTEQNCPGILLLIAIGAISIVPWAV